MTFLKLILVFTFLGFSASADPLFESSGFHCKSKLSMKLDRRLHGEPREAPPPFDVQVLDEDGHKTEYYEPGKIYTVRLIGYQYYRGLMLQARLCDEHGFVIGGLRGGRFLETPDWIQYGIRLQECDMKYPLEDSVTHADDNRKFVTQVQWTSARDVGNVQFMFTLASENDVYWERWRPRSGFLQPLYSKQFPSEVLRQVFYNEKYALKFLAGKFTSSSSQESKEVMPKLENIIAATEKPEMPMEAKKVLEKMEKPEFWTHHDGEVKVVDKENAAEKTDISEAKEKKAGESEFVSDNKNSGEAKINEEMMEEITESDEERVEEKPFIGDSIPDHESITAKLPSSGKDTVESSTTSEPSLNSGEATVEPAEPKSLKDETLLKPAFEEAFSNDVIETKEIEVTITPEEAVAEAKTAASVNQDSVSEATTVIAEEKPTTVEATTVPEESEATTILEESTTTSESLPEESSVTPETETTEKAISETTQSSDATTESIDAVTDKVNDETKNSEVEEEAMAKEMLEKDETPTTTEEEATTIASKITESDVEETTEKIEEATEAASESSMPEETTTIADDETTEVVVETTASEAASPDDGTTEEAITSETAATTIEEIAETDSVKIDDETPTTSETQMDDGTTPSPETEGTTENSETTIEAEATESTSESMNDKTEKVAQIPMEASENVELTTSLLSEANEDKSKLPEENAVENTSELDAATSTFSTDSEATTEEVTAASEIETTPSAEETTEIPSEGAPSKESDARTDDVVETSTTPELIDTTFASTNETTTLQIVEEEEVSATTTAHPKDISRRRR